MMLWFFRVPVLCSVLTRRKLPVHLPYVSSSRVWTMAVFTDTCINLFGGELIQLSTQHNLEREKATKIVHLVFFDTGLGLSSGWQEQKPKSLQNNSQSASFASWTNILCRLMYANHCLIVYIYITEINTAINDYDLRDLEMVWYSYRNPIFSANPEGFSCNKGLLSWFAGKVHCEFLIRCEYNYVRLLVCMWTACVHEQRRALDCCIHLTIWGKAHFYAKNALIYPLYLTRG